MHGEMEGKIRKRAVKGRCVIASLAWVMREKWAHGTEERFKDLYSANIDVWIRDLDME